MANHVYLKEILNRMTFVGIWKPSLNYPYSILHNVCSKIILFYFISFISTQITEIYYIRDGNELMENLALTLLYITTLGKILVSKSNKIKILVKDIWQFERKIFKNEYKNYNSLEEDNRSIYIKYVDYFHRINVFLSAVGVTTTFPFFIRPVVEICFAQRHNVSLQHQKPLPLSSWFPFDKNKYYYTSYTIQVIAVSYAATSIVLTDGFLLGLMIFVKGRIKIFQQQLRNVRKYVEESNVVDDTITEEDMPETKFIRRCCIEHQGIINYVKNLDKSVNGLMLLDFAICSVQIGITAFWLIVTDLSIQLVVVLIYFTAMLIQLFLFYWYANDVTHQSSQIALAIWNSDWLECSQSTKKTLLLIMLRAQKPLTLSVGPFYVMSNETAVMILRAAYSYVAVLSKVYGRDQ